MCATVSYEGSRDTLDAEIQKSDFLLVGLVGVSERVRKWARDSFRGRIFWFVCLFVVVGWLVVCDVCESAVADVECGTDGFSSAQLSSQGKISFWRRQSKLIKSEEEFRLFFFFPPLSQWRGLRMWG